MDQKTWNDGFRLGIRKIDTEWLISHIQGTDKKYAPYLIAKGVV